MRKYKNQLLMFFVAILTITNLYCSGSDTTDDPTDNITGSTTNIDPPTPPPIDTTALLIEKLESELALLKNSLQLNEKKCFSAIGDATVATTVAINPDLSPEDREIAQERAQIANDVVKKCEADKKVEKEDLEEKIAEIETKIRNLKEQ